MKTNSKEQVLTMQMREALKQIMQTEIENLPKTLEGLEPQVRLAFMCKLMPFVLPKVEAASHTIGEPWSADF